MCRIRWRPAPGCAAAREAVRVLGDEGPDDIYRLIDLGVPFDTDKNGKLKLTREGAHHCNRIVHIKGDATGLHATKHLLGTALKRENLNFFDNLMLLDVVTDANGETAGVTVMDGKNHVRFFEAPNVILATGGIGHVYRNSTNARCATGDGIAAALRAGASVRDMEFVQFHPTALVHPDRTGRFFLISEALRGEGAVLRNRRSEAFMKDVHPMADLAPRDVVARAIIAEMKKYDLPYVYLDISSRPRRFLKNRFPRSTRSACAGTSISQSTGSPSCPSSTILWRGGDGSARADLGQRPLRLRRVRQHWGPRREPPCQQLPARVSGVRQALRGDDQRLGAERPYRRRALYR
jgi:aspartate oxidase